MVLRSPTLPARHEPLLHLPRRGSRGSRGALSSNLKWVLLLIVVTAVGWIQLSRYESKLHALRQAADTDGHVGAASASDREAQRQQGQASLTARLELEEEKEEEEEEGQRSPSQACAALLEAKGILPSPQGHWLGRQGAASGASGTAASGEAGRRSGGAGSQQVEAAASQTLNMLVSRRRLYDSMEASLMSHGLALGSSITQGLGMGDMFQLDADGALQPVLQALTVPVRAIVLPLSDPAASQLLLGAVRRHLAPLVPSNGIWLQNSSLYHSTIYHASTHTAPVPASAADVDAEETAVRSVGLWACPLHVVLERVVATPAGTVVACWQVVDGTDVSELRRELAAALPHASKQQIVKDHSILHTTLARIVLAPRAGDGGGAAASGAVKAQQRLRQRQLKQRQGRRQHALSRQDGSEGGGGGGGSDAEAEEVQEEAAVLLQAAVDQMTRELCGVQAVLDRLWFAEEYHKLALALNGRVEKREVPLQCASRWRGAREAEGGREGGSSDDDAAGGGDILR